MTHQLTDDALAKRAEALYYNGNETAIHYIFDALKVHRESLKVLEECRDAMVANDVHGWAFDLTTHIASLRELLGVSQ